MAGQGVVAQINTEECPQLAARFRISGVPTVVLFNNGVEIDRISGTMEKNQLLAWWNRHDSSK